MILTIDLNPTMDRIFAVDELYNGDLILAKSSSLTPGGQGVMAMSLLDTFNEDVFMSGFLGGLNGEFFHKHLLDAGLAHEFLPVKEETRTKIKIMDNEKNITTILEESPRITREEVGRFYGLYTKLVEKASIICCVGNGQFAGFPDDIYSNLIKIARDNQKKIILEIGEQGLNLAIDALPYMAIIDEKQLESILGVKLNFENEIIKAGRYILDKGIKYLVINLYNRGSMVLGQDKGYILDIETEGEQLKDMKSSSMAAGFAMGFNRNYDTDMILRLGQAFAIASSKEDINKIELRDIKRLMGEIEIYPVNY